MKSNIAVLLAGLAFATLAGCQKNPETGTPANANDPTPGSSPAVSAAPPGGSVAAPESATPASDAGMAPDAAAGTGSSGSSAGSGSGDANSPTQANPSTLSEQQEEATMPESGQVNNHSVPDTTDTKK